MEKIRAWYYQQASNETFNIRYLLLWFMVAVFPLIVVPHPFYISFAMGVVTPSYFYLPRYIVLGVVAVVALIILLKDRTRIKHPAFIPLALFIIFSTVAASLAPIQMTAWLGSPYRFTGLTTYYFCIVLFILAHTSNKTDKLLNSLVITAAIVSFLALLQYFGINLVPHEDFRDKMGLLSYGTMPHPNFLGTYTAFILPGAILLYMRSKKILNLVCASLIYAGLVVSLCRGAWIASLFGLLIIVCHVCKKPDMKRSLLILTGIFAAITLLLMPAHNGLLLTRILSLHGSSGLNLNDSAGSYRMYIWRGAFHLFLLYWPFGIGPDHLIYAKLITPANEIADKAHNIYLEMGLTMGLFTLLSYLAFLSFFLKKWRSEIGFILFTMVMVYLIQGFTNIDVVAIMPLFWIILGLSLDEYQKEKTTLYLSGCLDIIHFSYSVAMDKITLPTTTIASE